MSGWQTSRNKEGSHPGWVCTSGVERRIDVSGGSVQRKHVPPACGLLGTPGPLSGGPALLSLTLRGGSASEAWKYPRRQLSFTNTCQAWQVFSFPTLVESEKFLQLTDVNAAASWSLSALQDTTASLDMGPNRLPSQLLTARGSSRPFLVTEQDCGLQGSRAAGPRSERASHLPPCVVFTRNILSIRVRLPGAGISLSRRG